MSDPCTHFALSLHERTTDYSLLANLKICLITKYLSCLQVHTYKDIDIQLLSDVNSWHSLFN